jgi:hypothetical protein
LEQEVLLMPVQYVQRMVNFELSDYRLVKDCALEYGLGSRSFSAATRLIIREWQRYRDLYFLQREFLASQKPDQPAPPLVSQPPNQPVSQPVGQLAHQPPNQPELDK